MHTNWRLARRRETLEVRAATLQAIREFFFNQHYLEVETPHRIPAPAPEPHIDAVPADGWFLHTSPELCMKRLLAAGYSKIFQICRCWREGERGKLHVPEFTLLEWYTADSNYGDLMHQSEALIQHVARQLDRGDSLIYQGVKINLIGPWPRMSVREAFSRHAPISMSEALQQDLYDEVMIEEIEPQLPRERPVFLYDHPAQRGALARLRADDPTVAERVELYIGGLELANGFTELTDAGEQRSRFEREEAYRRSHGKRPYPLPERFLAELRDLPPAAGMALGVDRLVMLFVDAESIDEVIAFAPEEL